MTEDTTDSDCMISNAEPDVNFQHAREILLEEQERTRKLSDWIETKGKPAVNKLKDIEMKHEEKTIQLFQANETTKALNEEINQLNIDNKLVNTKYDEIQKQYLQLQQQIEPLKKLYHNDQQLTQQLKHHNKQISEKLKQDESKLNQLSEEIKLKNENITQLTAQCEKHSNHINTLNKQIIGKDNKIKALEFKSNQLQEKYTESNTNLENERKEILRLKEVIMGYEQLQPTATATTRRSQPYGSPIKFIRSAKQSLLSSRGACDETLFDFPRANSSQLPTPITSIFKQMSSDLFAVGAECDRCKEMEGRMNSFIDLLEQTMSKFSQNEQQIQLLINNNPAQKIVARSSYDIESDVENDDVKTPSKGVLKVENNTENEERKIQEAAVAEAERHRLEKERLEKERLEKEEQQRLENERLEKLEKQRIEKERIEKERIENEIAENEIKSKLNKHNKDKNTVAKFIKKYGKYMLNKPLNINGKYMLNKPLNINAKEFTLNKNAKELLN